MAMPEGTKKWGTLATMTDAECFDYFTTTRAQRPDHALNSIRLLRAQYDHTGARRSTPLDKSAVVIDAAVKARGGEGSTPAPSPAHDAAREQFDGVYPDSADTADFKPAPASPATPDAPAPKFEAQISGGHKDPAGAALAAMVAPHILDTLAPHLKTAIEQMHAHLAAHQATRLVIVRDAVQTKLEGTHHNAAPKVIQLVAQGLNVMLVGPAGCGKTVLASSVAKAMEAELTCISCSAGMSEAQLLGRLLPLGDNGAFRYVESPFVKAYREGGVILLDEMDAADANLLLVINAALANGAIDIEARAASGLTTRVERHAKTVVIAAANTWGAGADTQYIGRGALDVSTLDRFYRLAIDYDEALERQLGTPQVVSFVQVLRRKVREAKLRRVVSTRMITRMGAAINAGVSFNEAKRDELQSWTADERAKVGEQG